ncbi:unnamed protein product, partial [Gulo gulo]
NITPGEVGTRQDSLKALSSEVSGLRRRGARKVTPGGGRHSWVRFCDSERGNQGSRAGRESVGSFIGPRQGMG